jgi:hypothetical protein
MIKLPTALALAAVLLAPLSASAQTPEAKPKAPASAPARVDQNGETLTYTFTDDGLLGDTLTSNAARITVRPKAARLTLTRPRTSFIARMFRSVEDL